MSTLLSHGSADAALVDRAEGAMLGLAVGDALGTTLEFEERDELPLHTEMTGGGAFNLAPGVWTDDTSMALCLADTLITKRRFSRYDFSDRLVRWWKDGENSPTGECFDIGGTTRAALEIALADRATLLGNGGPCGLSNERSAGNGSLVRGAPVAIVYGEDPWATRGLAAAQSSVTHASMVCIDACSFLALSLASALAGEAKEVVLAPRNLFTSPEVKRLALGDWRIKCRAEVRSTGYVIDTLEAALWSVSASSSFEEALITAVNLGGDADSIGAVTGQLAGAHWGASSIPKRWLEQLAWREHIERRARELAAIRLGRPPSSRLQGKSAGTPRAFDDPSTMRQIRHQATWRQSA